jgi:GntR family transcriptional regulator
MFDLDLRSRKPIYEQLVDKLKELIINEVLKADEQLPSVRTLAQQLTINPNTIQKAYRELEIQGYIYSVKGRGSFVTPSSDVKDVEKIMKVKKELEKLVSEALYLGMTVNDLYNVIIEVDASIGGGNQDDPSKASNKKL